MRKWIIALLALSLFAPGALALGREAAEQIAREATDGAEVTRIERDGGVYEISLRGEGARYEVELLNDGGAILEIETRYDGTKAGASYALTEDEARAAAAKLAPGAIDGIVKRDRAAGGATYAVFYSDGSGAGEITVDAEGGAILATKRYPAAEDLLDVAELTRRIEARLPGARIAELELAWDDGRYAFEGEAAANGGRYAFELDAKTGALLELERDD